MKNKKIAVLITCHNRKDKTMACLASFYKSEKPLNHIYDIFLTDDGSTDGTSQEVSAKYPKITIIKGNGNLYWAGGMRLAWKTAIAHDSYDAFLLLNDDVILMNDFIKNISTSEEYSMKISGVKGIYSGATIDNSSRTTTYGGLAIEKNHVIVRTELLDPLSYPQECEVTNANILWIDKSVVQQIGILDDKFTHSLADFDYSLRAHKKGIPIILAPNVCGVCEFDHGNNWKSGSEPLKRRIAYLKSPKGLAYNEYLFYIKRHFPLFLPYTFIMLWGKTLFPFIWDRLKL